MKPFVLTQEQWDTYPLFKGIGEKELNQMLPCLQAVNKPFTKGSFIILDEEEVQHVCMVLTGTIHMLKEDSSGSYTLLTTVHRGELFGESYSLNMQLSHVSFRAAEDSMIMLFPLNKVIYTCDHTCPFHQRIIRNSFRMITEKNMHLISRLEILSKETLREKILCYLRHESQSQKTSHVQIRMNRTEMAAYLNCNRSAMSRELSKMQREGLLDIDKTVFTLLQI